MQTTTFYPDAHPETTTVDGFTYCSTTGAQLTWAQLRGNTSPAVATAYDGATNNLSAYVQANTDNDKWKAMKRSIFLFDTSSLKGSSIISATLKLYVYAEYHQFSGELVLVSSNPASNTGLVGDDYSTLGATDYSDRITISTITPSEQITFTLNTAGKAAISKTGVTKLGIRIGSDVDDSAPTWASNEQDRIDFKAVDTAADNSQKPQLIVVTSDTAAMLMGSD